MLIRFRRGYAAALTFALMFGCVTLAQDDSWSARTESDLRFVHDILFQESPGPIDTENLWFKRWWEKGFAESLQKTKEVSTRAGYLAVLRYYISGFHDGHVTLNPVEPASEEAKWPGFVLSLKTGAYVVSHVDSQQQERGPKVGSVLRSCDGTSPEAMMKRDVLPYYGNPDWESHWVRLAPRLLVDDGNPWVKRPHTCTFRVDGRDRVFDLTWQLVDARRLGERLVDAAYGKPQNYGVRSWDTNGVWVSIPSWSPQTDEAKASLEAIIRDATNWRNFDILVFDTRGGGGGDASYSRRLVRGLYGDEYIRSLGDRHPFNLQWIADWRASKGNAASAGERLSAKANEALRQGAPLFREEFQIVPPSAESPMQVSNPVKGTVVLLTDGRCFSNCWLFTRDVLGFPQTLHVGAPTNAMTPYTQPRRHPMPSGLMSVAVPQKVFRAPLDHFRQQYVPAHRWDGDFTDTPALEAWIRRLVREAR